MIGLVWGPLEPQLADAFHRPITYLRISVTDRCNLRCVYCMPEEGLPWIDKREILTYEDIDDIALTTNGLLLAEQVQGLVAAGLKRANISLDTLREDRFQAIARRPGLQRVLEGIDAAFAAGLGPVKLNCVVMRGQNDDEVEAFAEMTRDRAVAVRFIEVMPVHENVDGHTNQYVSATEI